MSTDIAITVLQRFFTLISSSSEPRAVLAGIADSAHMVLDAEGIAIFEYDGARRTFSVATARGLSLEAQVQTMQTLNYYVAESEAWLSQLQVIHAWGRQLQAREKQPAEDIANIEGMISVPLRASQGNLLGILVALYQDAADMTGRRQVLASLLGGMAVVSLENARLYEAERHRANFLDEVLHIGETLRVDQSLDSVLTKIVRIISETLGWQTVVVALHDFDAGVTRPAAHIFHKQMYYNAYMEQLRHLEPLPIREKWPWLRPEFKVSRSYFGDQRQVARLSAVEESTNGSSDVAESDPVDADQDQTTQADQQQNAPIEIVGQVTGEPQDNAGSAVAVADSVQAKQGSSAALSEMVKEMPGDSEREVEPDLLVVDHDQPEQLEPRQIAPIEIVNESANGSLSGEGQTSLLNGSCQWHQDNFLIVPLLHKGVELGWVSVDAPRDKQCPTLPRVQELEVFADQLVLAVINARLYNEAEQERFMLTTVLDGITDGVLAFDGQDRLMFFNRAAERLLGVEMPHVPNASLDSVLAASPLLAFLRDPIRETEPTGELFLREYNRTLYITATPLQYIGQLVLMQDMTYFREMDELRLELLASLSHDLKNPMSAIGLTASLIERSGVLNERQKKYVDRLRMASQRAVTMIGDLLDMARLEAGERIAEKACSIPAIIDDVLIEMMTHIEEKGLILTWKPVEVPDVQGDPVRLQQVVANLISNAVKYTPHGGSLTVNVAHVDSELQVGVRDNGLGIPTQYQSRIFDRFYRVNPTMSDEIEGTGLGLTIVRTVVERHGGRVWVESVVNEGSLFTFTLPVPQSV